PTSPRIFQLSHLLNNVFFGQSSHIVVKSRRPYTQAQGKLRGNNANSGVFFCQLANSFSNLEGFIGNFTGFAFTSNASTFSKITFMGDFPNLLSEFQRFSLGNFSSFRKALCSQDNRIISREHYEFSLRVIRCATEIILLFPATLSILKAYLFCKNL